MLRQSISVSRKRVHLGRFLPHLPLQQHECKPKRILINNSGSSAVSPAAGFHSRCCALNSTSSPAASSSLHMTTSTASTALASGTKAAALLASKLTASVMNHVEEFGFAIIDNALDEPALARATSLPPASTSSSSSNSSSATNTSSTISPAASPSAPLALALRNHILALYEAKHSTRNHTHFFVKHDPSSPSNNASSSSPSAPPTDRYTVAKSAINEMDFAVQQQLADKDSDNDTIKFFGGFVHDPRYISSLNRALTISNATRFENHASRSSSDSSSNESPHVPPQPMAFEKVTVKAQVNEGQGGCFPIHFDTDRKVDSRRLTAILYLNPEWNTAPMDKGGDGGELRLYPFPHASVDVAPVHNRLVLFDSNRLLHRVLPAKRQRVCVTLWFWQQQQQWRAGHANARKLFVPNVWSVQHEKRTLEILALCFPTAEQKQLKVLSQLIREPYYSHLSKLFYEHEWFMSLEQSHPVDAEATQIILANHLEQCERIQAALGPILTRIGPAPNSAAATTTTAQPGSSNSSSLSQPEQERWKSWFPLPWVVSPKLPPFARFVRTPPSFPSNLSSSGEFDPWQRRMIEWMGE